MKVDCIHLTQNTVQWQVFVIPVMNLTFLGIQRISGQVR